MKRTAEEAAKTRQAILDAALAIFSRDGYNASRLHDIAAAAGVTRGAVYHHFGNKQRLYEQLMTEASAGANNIVMDAIAEGGSFRDISEKILIRGFEQIENDEKVRKIMEIYLFKSDFSAELSHISTQLEQQAVSGIQSIAAYMQMGIGQGQISPDVNPEDAARAFIAFQNGLMQLWLMNTSAFSLKERAPFLVKIFLDGLIQSEKVTT